MARNHIEPTRKAVTKHYVALPTCSLFHNNANFVRGLLGPVGSGKSVACLMELFIKACAETPSVDGVRSTKFLVVRKTYSELKTTTIASFLEWFGGIGEIVMDSPIRFNSKLELGDGTRLDWTVLFKSVDGSDASLNSLRSLEITGAFLNEAHEVSSKVISVIKSRIGRYRPIKSMNPAWSGIIMDSNFGLSTSPLRKLVAETPLNHSFFIQPPAVFEDPTTGEWVFNVDAENLNHLPNGLEYYKRMLPGMQRDQVEQLLANRWANPMVGKPIWPEFDTNGHVYRGVQQLDKALPLVVGLDFGLHAAAAIGQMGLTGRLQVVDEVWNDDIDLESFLDTMLVPLLRSKYRGFRVIVCGDPAGTARSQHDKRTSFNVLKSRNLEAYPAVTNNFVARRDAVRAFLLRANGFLVTNSCTRLIEGMGGAYGYKELADGTFDEKADKNNWSHICDAIQYLALYVRNGKQYAKSSNKVRSNQFNQKPKNKRKHFWA